MSALQAPQVSISGFPFVPYSRGHFPNLKLILFPKLRGKEFDHTTKPLAQLEEGGGWEDKKNYGAAVNGGRDDNI